VRIAFRFSKNGYDCSTHRGGLFSKKDKAEQQGNFENDSFF